MPDDTCTVTAVSISKDRFRLSISYILHTFTPFFCDTVEHHHGNHNRSLLVGGVASRPSFCRGDYRRGWTLQFTDFCPLHHRVRFKDTRYDELMLGWVPFAFAGAYCLVLLHFLSHFSRGFD
jgi:hypothetical protein